MAAECSTEIAEDHKSEKVSIELDLQRELRGSSCKSAQASDFLLAGLLSVH